MYWPFNPCFTFIENLKDTPVFSYILNCLFLHLRQKGIFLISRSIYLQAINFNRQLRLQIISIQLQNSCESYQCFKPKQTLPISYEMNDSIKYTQEERFSSLGLGGTNKMQCTCSNEKGSFIERFHFRMPVTLPQKSNVRVQEMD